MAARLDGVDIERKIARAIVELTDDLGYPPTVREIAHAVGLRSTSSVAYRLRAMEKAGIVTHTPGASRSYRVLIV